MPLYEFQCPAHGRVEAFAPEAAQTAPCPECGQGAARRFSVPVTDCASFGRSMMPARTKPTDRRPTNEISEELIHGYQRRDGTHRQYGAGKTTGS